MIPKNSASELAQPRELYDLFVVELWERFAYYGVSILLVFFIADYLHLSRIDTVELNGAFIALVYASPTFGGFLADKILGVKRTLVMGAGLLAFGYLFLAFFASVPKEYFSDPRWYLGAFYWAMGCIAIGNGCFKPNPTSLLSKVYKPQDPRIDAGYTIFYMSINIGSLMSMILTPIVQAYFGYTPAFLLCSLGLVLGLIYFITKLPRFKEMGVEADFAPLTVSKIMGVGSSILCLTLFAGFLLANLFYAKILIFSTVTLVISTFVYLSFNLPKTEGNKVLAILIILFITAIFFSLQLQMFGVLNIFIDQHVNRSVMGYQIPAGNYAALNGFWVAILGPMVAKFYMHFERKNAPLNMPVRFAAGLFIASFGFYVLSISHLSTSNGLISSWWIVGAYLIISLGEILVSALGLAFICKLAPQGHTSIFMGAYLLALAISGWISGLVGHLIEIPQGVTDMQFMLEAYTSAFFKVANLSLGASVISVMLIPYMLHLTGEKYFKYSHQAV